MMEHEYFVAFDFASCRAEVHFDEAPNFLTIKIFDTDCETTEMILESEEAKHFASILLGIANGIKFAESSYGKIAIESLFKNEPKRD